MIVLPLIVNDTIFSLELSFKDMKQKKEVLQADRINLPANDLVVGKISLKEDDNSLMYDKNASMVTSFVRKFMATSSYKPIYITTSNYHDTDFYDVYKVPCPPVYSNSLIDFLYGSLVNDLRLRAPEKEKAKIITLKAIGVDQLFSDEILDDLMKIKKESHDQDEYLDQLSIHGYSLQVQVLQFLDSLKFKIIDETMMPIKRLELVTESFKAIPSKIDSKLIHYRKQADDNYASYTLLARANHIIYDKPLTWPMLSLEQQKILQKKAI